MRRRGVERQRRTTAIVNTSSKRLTAEPSMSAARWRYPFCSTIIDRSHRSLVVQKLWIVRLTLLPIERIAPQTDAEKHYQHHTAAQQAGLASSARSATASSRSAEQRETQPADYWQAPTLRRQRKPLHPLTRRHSTSHGTARGTAQHARPLTPTHSEEYTRRAHSLSLFTAHSLTTSPW